MKNFVIGILMVACVVLIGYVVLLQKKVPEEKTPKQPIAATAKPPVQKAPYQWPAKARFAQCSADGRTVAFADDRDLVLTRDGEELYRLKHLRMRHPYILTLSPDGRYMALRWIAKRGILVWNVDEQKEVRLIPTGYNDRPRFVDGTLTTKGKVEISMPVPFREVTTSAVCSCDGRTVLTTDKEKITCARQGKVLFTMKPTLAKPILNRDGSRLCGYDGARGTVVLMDTTDGKEMEDHKVANDAVYHFSPGGALLGILKPGSKELFLYRSSTGYQHARIPATSTHYSVTEEHVIDDFHWPNPWPTDERLHVNMRVQKDHSTLQWVHLELGWRYNPGIQLYASLDQDFDFNEDGTLSPDARD